MTNFPIRILFICPRTMDGAYKTEFRENLSIIHELKAIFLNNYEQRKQKMANLIFRSKWTSQCR